MLGDWTWILVYLDLGGISAILNVVSALSIVTVMQAVTRDYSLYTELGMVKFCHRLAFGTLAGALGWNAYRTIETDANPRMEDVLVQLALIAVVGVSFIRHLMARPAIRTDQDPKG